MSGPAGELDLGSGCSLRFTRWDPDLKLNPQYEHLRFHLPVVRWGAIVSHPADTPTGSCDGGITFDGPVQRVVEPNRPRWTVESWDPLTISPSILCSCGAHGFIREGRWVRA